MGSPSLIKFLKTVGGSVHSINTIVVGLTSIESGEYKKPEDLTITWNTSDNAFSARRARSFALKSALVYVDDALSNYLKGIKVLIDDKILNAILSRRNPQFDSNLEATFRDNYPATFDLFDKKNIKATSPDEKDKKHVHLSSIDRIHALNEFFNFEKIYWSPCIVMLIRWRNKIVHQNSTGNLNPQEIKILENNKDDISANHANIDIVKTITQFNNNEITLKDFTTLIAISIRYVKFIDEQIFKSVNKIEIIESFVKKRKELLVIYNSIACLENETIRKRKFGSFIKTNFSHLDNSTLNMLYPSFKLISKQTEQNK